MKSQIAVKENKRSLKKRILENWDLYVMLIIPLALLFVFCYYPMAGLQIAFKNFSPSKGIWESSFVGMKQFEKMFRYHGFYGS